MTILPGEDSRRFAQLHSDLIEEWKPVGPTEHDAVLTIAKCIWRKDRVQMFLLSKFTACQRDATHPSYNAVTALHALCKLLEIDPDILDSRVYSVSEELRLRLNADFPPEDFRSKSERVRAIQNEIKSNILPRLQLMPKPVEVSFIESADIMKPEDLLHEITSDEQHDAMLERAMKRLLQGRTMKQMLGQSALNKFEQGRLLRVVSRQGVRS
jgi:hypothetical protein